MRASASKVPAGLVLLGAFVGLNLLAGRLAFKTEGGNRAGHQALEADGLGALLALVDFPSLEAADRLLDLA